LLFGDEQERQLKAPIMQDKIQPFYNRFSYPLADLKYNSNVNGAKLFKILDREMQTKGFKGKTFLDVGCGAWASNIGCCQGFSFSQVLRL